MLEYKTDLQALSLVGHKRENPVLYPLAVLHLNNRLYIPSFNLFTFYYSCSDQHLCPRFQYKTGLKFFKTGPDQPYLFQFQQLPFSQVFNNLMAFSLILASNN